MVEEIKKTYLEAILDTNRELAFEVVDSALKNGHSPETVIFDILIPVMADLAEIVRVGPDATLAQLYLASQISSDVTDRLVPQFTKKPQTGGTMVIGTAAEDFHGLGKKIVSGCVKAQMIKIIDLGLNVPAEKFVKTAVENNASIIGISSMMVHTARGENGPIKVREILKSEGLENRIRLVVGGAPYRFHPTLYREVGADAWADNGIGAAELIAGLIREGAA